MPASLQPAIVLWDASSSAFNDRCSSASGTPKRQQSLNSLQSAYRDGRVAHDPLSGLVDVGPCGEVHEGVCAPHRAPLELLDLLCRAQSYVPKSYVLKINKLRVHASAWDQSVGSDSLPWHASQWYASLHQQA